MKRKSDAEIVGCLGKEENRQPLVWAQTQSNVVGRMRPCHLSVGPSLWPDGGLIGSLLGAPIWVQNEPKKKSGSRTKERASSLSKIGNSK